MPRTLRILAFLLLVLAGLPSVSAADTMFKGRVSLDGGHLDHPLGVAVENASAYLQGKLGLTLLAQGGSSDWRFTYEGDLVRFEPEVPLDYGRHAVGVEWIRSAAREDWTLSAGLQGGLRRNIEGYRIYDYQEAYGYLAFKKYPRPNVMLRGWAGLRTRIYDDLPEESYLEPHAVLEIKRFGEDRTTLGVSARLGGKWFHDPVAKNVWGTAGTPVTSQFVVAADAAKGLSERVGVRARFDHRFTLADFPYWVGDDIYDSPLLDRYARAGSSALAAAKWLTPLQTWLEVGGAWTRDDYGEIVFATGAGGSQRADTILTGFAALERRFVRSGRGAILRATVSWRDQSSNLDAYTWSGLAATAGLEWRW